MINSPVKPNNIDITVFNKTDGPADAKHPNRTLFRNNDISVDETCGKPTSQHIDKSVFQSIKNEEEQIVAAPDIGFLRENKLKE